MADASKESCNRDGRACIAQLEEELATARSAVGIAQDSIADDASKAMIDAARRIEDVAVQLQNA